MKIPKPKLVTLNADFSNLRKYRLYLGENQTNFYARFGISQTTGCRYEKGRIPSDPIRMLIMAFACGEIGDDTLARLMKKAGIKPLPG